MPAGPNLTDEELQKLHELLMNFQASQEFLDFAGEPEDHEVVDGTTKLINYARVSRTKEE